MYRILYLLYIDSYSPGSVQKKRIQQQYDVVDLMLFRVKRVLRAINEYFWRSTLTIRKCWRVIENAVFVDQVRVIK